MIEIIVIVCIAFIISLGIAIGFVYMRDSYKRDIKTIKYAITGSENKHGGTLHQILSAAKDTEKRLKRMNDDVIAIKAFNENIANIVVSNELGNYPTKPSESNEVTKRNLDKMVDVEYNAIMQGLDDVDAFSYEVKGIHVEYRVNKLIEIFHSFGYKVELDDSKVPYYTRERIANNYRKNLPPGLVDEIVHEMAKRGPLTMKVIKNASN